MTSEFIHIRVTFIALLLSKNLSGINNFTVKLTCRGVANFGTWCIGQYMCSCVRVRSRYRRLAAAIFLRRLKWRRPTRREDVYLSLSHLVSVPSFLPRCIRPMTAVCYSLTTELLSAIHQV